MKENLKRWRKEMDEYRENMQDIRKDAKVTLQIKKNKFLKIL